MNKILIILVSVNLFIGNVFSETLPKITILFTNNTLAELSPCGCAVGQTGGFPRRVSLINEQRKDNPNLLIVDSGDTLFETSRVTSNFKSELESKALLIRDIYKKIKVDAMVPGELDFALGLSFLKKLNLPYVSANIVENGKNAFKSYIIVKREKLKIAIIGVCDPKAFSKKEISIADPVESINRSIKSMEEKVDLKILLSHGGILFDQELAKNISGIDFIISGHDGMRTDDPIVSNKIPILEAERMGKYIGKLSINIGDDIHNNLNETQRAKKELWWQEEELSSYVKKAGFKDLYKSDELIEFYKGEDEAIENIKRHIQKIEELKSTLKKLPSLNTSGFTNEFILLNEEYEEDIATKKLIESFKTRFNTI